MNGVNRQSTNDEKYYWLPIKREKNYRLPIGKILTDYRHGPTLSIYFFHKEEHIVFFSTFLRSNQRYHRRYKFHWKDKGEKPGEHFFSVNGRHKSFYKYTTKRGYLSVSAEHMKISTEQPSYSYTKKILSISMESSTNNPRYRNEHKNSSFLGQTQSLSKTVFKPTVWKRYMDNIFSVWDINRGFLRTSKLTLLYY